MADYILPGLVIIIIISGLLKKVPIYDTFIEGSKESFKMIFQMFPSILAMVLSINILISSGIIDKLVEILSFSNLPVEILPLALVRPISGGASLAITTNLLKEFGPDSYIGRLASVLMGSTETTFYVLTLYFGSIGITKMKYAIKVGLLVDFIAVIISIIVVNIFFL